MKTRIEQVALNFAIVGLALVAPAVPARAAELVPSSLSRSKDLGSPNILTTVNGMCPSNFPCTSSRVTSFGLR